MAWRGNEEHMDCVARVTGLVTRRGRAVVLQCLSSIQVPPTSFAVDARHSAYHRTPVDTTWPGGGEADANSE
jgi:hypothetical protein